MFENVCTQIFTFNAYSQPHSRTEVYLFLLSERYLIATHLIPLGKICTIYIMTMMHVSCLIQDGLSSVVVLLMVLKPVFLCFIRCNIYLILLQTYIAYSFCPLLLLYLSHYIRENLSLSPIRACRPSICAFTYEMLLAE